MTEYGTDDDEERAYWEVFKAAQNFNYPGDFKAFCIDFDFMILQAQLQTRLDNMETDDESR